MGRRPPKWRAEICREELFAMSERGSESGGDVTAASAITGDVAEIGDAAAASGSRLKPSDSLAPQLVIISGVSGSGKSTALKAFEDMGFYCVDNLPSPLIPHFADLLLAGTCKSERNGSSHTSTEHTEMLGAIGKAMGQTGAATPCDTKGGKQLQLTSRQLALLLDCRQERDFSFVQGTLERLTAAGVEVRVLFLESHNDVIVRRFRETRRPHPMLLVEPDLKSIKAAIKRERELLAPFRERATWVIDSSSFSPHDLRRAVEQLFHRTASLEVQIVSFGFKYGAPHDADLIVDVRFLPNPHFVPQLQAKTGKELEVQQYVYSGGEADEFLRRYIALLEFLLPRYKQEGKRYLAIGIGCTGGMHRSVTIAIKLGEALAHLGYQTTVTHREL